MITQREVDEILQKESGEKEISRVSYQMTDADLKAFEKCAELPGMIADRKIVVFLLLVCYTLIEIV